MSCDRIGNLLLAKFSAHGAPDTCVVIPATIVFWLLKHLPVNQDPNLLPPPSQPQITQWDWDDPSVPRAQSVNCREFPDAIRMTFHIDRKADLTLVLDRSNIELIRQVMLSYGKDLIDLDAE
jgi:hypothetical protein